MAESDHRHVYRIALIALAIVGAIGFAFRPPALGTGAPAIVSLLVLSALPLIAAWATPGNFWVKTFVFALVFVACGAATISLLGPKQARPVIEIWLWMLAVVGGGLLYWLLQEDR